MSRPAPKYEYRLVPRRNSAPFRARVRIPDCHPERKHYSDGVCVECAAERLRERLARERRQVRCRNCRKRFRPGALDDEAPEARVKYCSFRCQVVAESLSPGDGWRAHWPGAGYQWLREVPVRCPRARCGGVHQETVTGVVCTVCGVESHVAEALVRAVLTGRDASVMRSAEAL